MLILEIWLTSFVWRRGWKGWALLPLALCGAFAFMYGYMSAADGGKVDPGVGLIFDFPAVIALGVMAAMGRKPTVVPSAQAPEEPSVLEKNPSTTSG